MSNPINDGGPAFPVPGVQVRDHRIPSLRKGMTLRDYFAGQALTGMILNSTDIDFGNGGVNQAAAVVSYRLADAMIAARNAGGAS